MTFFRHRVTVWTVLTLFTLGFLCLGLVACATDSGDMGDGFGLAIAHHLSGISHSR